MATISIALCLATRITVPFIYPNNLQDNTAVAWLVNIGIQLEVTNVYIFLVSGLLADIILIHRCYRLWGSKRRVIVFPSFVVLATFGLSIVIAVVWKREYEPPQYAGSSTIAAITVNYMSYLVITLLQNLLLTGMIVGRLWWLNRTTKKLLGGGTATTSQSLFAIILESGVLLPMFIIVAIVLKATQITDPNLAFAFFDLFLGMNPTQGIIDYINATALTQVVGIASTLIIVRVGLGVDALPNSQNSRTTFSSAEDEESINPEELNPMAYVNNGEIEHFQLKYTLDELQVDHNCLVDPMDGSKIRLEYHPIDQSHNPQSIGC
ncbi:hypothetical protein BT96DRAFT_1019548 [Gymnopus androsaceus JB14]|uniref:Uncharacterized protein n=1 Tax=Gymnopus androsaceus JB14 TaxID=1447944 RepID=A0A6A4HNR8_9AGAR|nr:hypothetical protein BT96DRAFT_1019548 [Gymnopus androsaceus JB14]